ncbi:GGDEF domain-containing protein [Yoonia rosea]|nr:GGDEF domain-containing protein [Yoonia rosea]
MSYLVEVTTIRSRLQIVYKPLIFLIFLMALVFCIENTLIPQPDRKTLLELFPIILPGWFLLSLLFFPTIAYLHNLKEEMSKLALTDDLTQLPSRRAFFNRAMEATLSGKGGYLLIIDVDFFKRVNDTYGHAVGDICLKAVADRLRTCTTDTDFCGRLGGEEFGFFLGQNSRDCLHMVADQLLEPIAVDLHAFGHDKRLALTLSIGSVDVAQSQPLERLFHRADLALYKAKESGRNQMVAWAHDLELTTTKGLCAG